MNVHRLALVATAALTIALAGCGNDEAGQPRTDACANVRPPEPVVTAGATMYPQAEALNEVLTQVQQRGETEFADWYAGVEVVPEQGHGIVYRKPNTEFDEMVRSAAGNQCVYLRDAAYNATTLRSLAERISGDYEYLKAQGIPVNSVGPLQDGSAVEVGVDPATLERARTELPKRYGTAPPLKIVDRGPLVPA